MEIPSQSLPMILIVEHDRGEHELLKQVLQSRYEVLSAYNGADALAIYETVAMKVRAVLLSVSLPDMDGLSLLKRMRFHSILPEIVVVSEQEDIHIAVEAMKQGASDYMTKPYHHDNVLKMIDTVIAQVDHSKKLDEMVQKDLLDQVDTNRRMALSQEMIMTKSAADDTVTPEEILSLFPLSDGRQDLSLGILREEMESYLGLSSQDHDTPHILIVEDEEIYRNMLDTFLSPLYKVFLAADAKEALEKANDHGPDVILLDIFLPDRSGAELISDFKELEPEVEIIVITAFEEVDLAVQTLKDGAFDFINKPVLKRDILSTVSNALHKKFLKKVLPKMGKEFLETKLSDSAKIAILNELCKNRRKKGKKVYMEDIYTFFPELRETYVPENLSLPDPILENGVGTFLEDLKSKMQFFNPLKE